MHFAALWLQSKPEEEEVEDAPLADLLPQEAHVQEHHQDLAPPQQPLLLLEQMAMEFTTQMLDMKTTHTKVHQNRQTVLSTSSMVSKSSVMAFKRSLTHSMRILKLSLTASQSKSLDSAGLMFRKTKNSWNKHRLNLKDGGIVKLCQSQL